ncbi:MAG TPA: EAL domain-containing protein [Steroidobacteraceae bacterium]
MDRPVRVLLLDADALDADTIKRQLESAGLEVTSRAAVDAAAFRSALAEFSPDIIALQRNALERVLKDSRNRMTPAVERALREKEQRLRDIVETTQDWLWELDGEGRYVFSNRAVKEILGYRPNDLLARNHLDYVHPDDRTSVELAWERMNREGYGTAGIVARWRGKSGEYRWLEKNVIPLIDRDGRVHGHRGADRDITVRRQQEARIARMNRVQMLLTEVYSAILHIRDREELLSEACRLAVQHAGYPLATAYVQQPGVKALRPVAWHSLAEVRNNALPLPLPGERVDGRGPVARAIQQSDTVVIANLADPDADVPFLPEQLKLGFHATVALPLLVDGTAIGALQLHSRDTEVFTDEELKLLRQLAGNISFALQYLKSQDTVEFLEYFDPLTALARRSLFLQRLAPMVDSAEKLQHALVVLVFDVERLRDINDSIGRHAGDRVLQLIAERLKSTFRDPRSMAHLGGGVFAVVFGDLVDALDASAVLKAEALGLFDDPYRVDGREIHIAVRAGLAHFADNARDADSLLRNAETALAHAKEAGEKYLHHRLSMNAEAEERLSRDNRLRRAVAEHEFLVHYQPKVNLATGAVEGAEALLRWNDPGYGIISPASFVPLLESLGLIDQVGEWVMRQALADARQCSERSGVPLRVAVNVSPRQLRQPDFAGMVLALIGRGSRQPVIIDLEITEGMLLEDIDGTSRKLERLRAAGIRISIDDFGTGYSSLRVLARLPVDELKIDRSFIKDLESGGDQRTVVETVIGLAKSFRLKTVAEGVETKEQAAILRELGCDAIQGYWISKPVGIPELEQWLSRAPRRDDSAIVLSEDFLAAALRRTG